MDLTWNMIREGSRVNIEGRVWKEHVIGRGDL
jgi:hypothetical protein